MLLKRLAIITSHPVQYNAPVFKMLAERNFIDSKVFYTWGRTVLENKFDPGFGKVVDWDIPLLDGYHYEFVENTADDKGTHHFKGIVNPGLIGRIDDFRPDALLIFGWAFDSHLKVILHYHNKKQIFFRGDSTLLDRSTFFKEQIRTVCLKWVYRHIDFALYAGRSNYEYFKKMGMKDAHLAFAPHAIDNRRFSADDEVRTREAVDLLSDMGIRDDKLVFLFAGKLEAKKDIKTLLKAFEISGLSKSTHLLVVGNGRLEEELKNAFRKVSSIHFLDFQNQSRMPVVYRLGDMFVLPSRGPGETWGLAVNEAMACNRPVLVSDRCGCAPDLVESGENGYIFRAGNIEDLADKMNMSAAKGKSGLNKMGQYSAHRISDFSFEKICEVVEKLLFKH